MKQTGKTFLCGLAASLMALPVHANETTISVVQVLNTSRQSGSVSSVLLMAIASAAVILLLLAMRSRRLAVTRRKLSEKKTRITHVFDPRNGLPTRPM